MHGIQQVMDLRGVEKVRPPKIRLLTHTQNAKRVVFTAIRTAYSPHTPAEIFADVHGDIERAVRKVYSNGQDDIDRLINHIVTNGHTSTLEHISFTFGVSGVSRSLLAQLTRHRMGVSVTVQSQRYVDDGSKGRKGGFEVVVPESVMKNPEALVIFMDNMVRIQEAYDKLRSMGVTKEDARYVLPNATTTNLTLTMNLRALLHFYKLRTGSGAQKEIKDFVEVLKEKVVEVEPWLKDVFEAEGGR